MPSDSLPARSRPSGQVRVGLAAAVAAAALAAAAAVPAHAGGSDPVPPITPSVTALPPLEAPAAGSGATAAGVAAALAPILAEPALGPGLSALVLDPATGQVLLDQAGSVARTPASSTKILTGATVLGAFGPDRRITTKVVQEPNGTVVIVGAGDPMLQDAIAPGTRTASLEQLALLAAPELLATPPAAPLTVAVDDTAFTGPTTVPGWGPDDLVDCTVQPIMALSVHLPKPAECVPDPDPAITAGTAFAARLAALGVPVLPAVGRAKATAGATELAAAQSPPMADLVGQALAQSDNTGAEMLGHLAGAAIGGEASFAGGAAATAKQLAAMQIPAPGLVLQDASGLSSADRIPPSATANLLRQIALGESPADVQLWPVAAGLPTAGFTGTLGDRFTGPAAVAGRGEVRAKTGTLVGVSALAGLVVTADGQQLVFVFDSDTVADILASRQAFDAASAALASCGCR